LEVPVDLTSRIQKLTLRDVEIQTDQAVAAIVAIEVRVQALQCLYIPVGQSAPHSRQTIQPDLSPPPARSIRFQLGRAGYRAAVRLGDTCQQCRVSTGRWRMIHAEMHILDVVASIARIAAASLGCDVSKIVMNPKTFPPELNGLEGMSQVADPKHFHERGDGPLTS
jgi:hypothetical protein